MKTLTSYLPIGMVWVVKLMACAVGFYLWGVHFVWVVLGLFFAWHALKAIASCLVTLICLIGLFWFLFTHIF